MRARTISPGFFKNEDLADLDFQTRVLFAGLWCLADRDGRLEDRPRKIKAELFPFDPCDTDCALQALHNHGFIRRYEADGFRLIQVTNFLKFQHPHPKETTSAFPPIPCNDPDNTKDIPKQDLGMTQHTPRYDPDNTKDMLDPSIPSIPSGSSIPSFPSVSSATTTSSVTLDGGSGSDEPNAFGDSPSPLPTVESYIADKLATPINAALVEDLDDFEAQGLELEAVRYAVDIALNAGSPTWRFTRAVIQQWLAKGVKTLDGAKAAQKQHDAAKASKAQGRDPTKPFDPYKIMNTPDRYKNDSEDIIEQWEREKRERAAAK